MFHKDGHTYAETAINSLSNGLQSWGAKNILSPSNREQWDGRTEGFWSWSGSEPEARIVVLWSGFFDLVCSRAAAFWISYKQEMVTWEICLEADKKCLILEMGAEQDIAVKYNTQVF